jgi:GNAT superfamily N-acetyltransferase
MALSASRCEISYRRGAVKDCDWIRRVVNSSGFLLYEGLDDAPTEELYDAQWAGIWAERLASSDQIYVVAETERYPGHKQLVAVARMQRKRPKMQMTQSVVALLEQYGGGLGAAVVAGEAYKSEPCEFHRDAEDPVVGTVYDAELMSLFVAKEFQGMGIGSTAFRLVAQLAAEQFGPTAFCWSVDEEAVRLFYTKNGGVPVGLHQDSHRRNRFGMAFAFDVATIPPPHPDVVAQLRTNEAEETEKASKTRTWDSTTRSWTWIATESQPAPKASALQLCMGVSLSALMLAVGARVLRSRRQ